jgi:hypothetical protein
MLQPNPYVQSNNDAAFARLAERNLSFGRARKAFDIVRHKETTLTLDEIEKLVIRALNGEFDEREEFKAKTAQQRG